LISAGSPDRLSVLRLTASFSLVALLVLCLVWELWLAPLRPGGSLLALKALPLFFPLRGVLRGERYAYQWSSMFILAWFAEGAMRAWSEQGIARALACGEIFLSLAFFGSAVAYARLGRRR